MKKDTFKYNMRLFYERWKWYFVNAYFVIGIALIVLLFSLIGTNKIDKNSSVNASLSKQEVVESNEQKQVENQQQKLQENDIVEQTNKQTQTKKDIDEQNKKHEISDKKTLVLVNEDAMADKVSAAMLLMIYDAQLVEIKRDINASTVDSILENTEDEKIELFVVGDSYVISEQSYNKFSDNENITAKRLSGVDMQKTMLSVLDYIKDDISFSRVYVANIVNADSCDYAFEMVIKYKLPILPIDYSGVSDDVIKIIDEYDVKEVEFIGEAIGSDIKKQFGKILGDENIKG